MECSVQSQQVQMSRSSFKAKKCEELTRDQVTMALSPKQVEDGATFLNQIKKLPGKLIPKECFEYVVEEWMSLCALRQAISLFSLLKDAENEENEQEITSLTTEIKQAKDKMDQTEFDLIEKVMLSSQRDDKLKQYVRSLYNYSQESSEQYQKVVEETIRKEASGEQEFQSILGKLYDTVKSIEWSKGEVQTLSAAKQKYEEQRRQKYDSIKILQKKLESIHQSYLKDYKTLCGLLPHDREELQGQDIEEVKTERQNNHLFNKLQNFLRTANQPSKQAIILNQLEHFITLFLTKVDLPQSDVRLIAQSLNLNTKIQNILQIYSKIVRDKSQELEKEKVAYRLLKQQWQISSQKNKVLVNDMQSLKKNHDDMKIQNEGLITRNKQIQAQDTQLKASNQTLSNKCTETQQTIDRQRNEFLDRLKETEERIKNKYDQQRKVLQEQLREARQKRIEEQAQIRRNLIRSPSRPQQNEQSMIIDCSSIFSNLSKTLQDQSLRNQLNQILWNRYKFTSASLLYRSHPKHKTNIHEYIDNRRNVLLVAKTDKLYLGVFLGCGISGMDRGVGSDSFLFYFKDLNLTVLPLIAGKEAFYYSKDALIFGDSELRIEFSPFNISSNLGKEGCHYDTKDINLSFFLQEGRELSLQMVEVFHLLVEGEVARLQVEEQNEGPIPQRPMVDEKQLIVQRDLNQIQNLQQHIKELVAQNTVLLQATRQRDYNVYFPNEILNMQWRKKRFIISAVQEQEGCEVAWTRLLYRSDPHNKTNFHKYIDQVPNILLLARLKNGNVVAGYSNHPFAQGCKGGDNGLLFNVTTEQTFKLRIPNKAIFYDEYYIIFGNSELRVKSGQSLIYSNFGISNSYFDCGQLTVDALFGEGKQGKELQLDRYEIYQLVVHA